MKDLMVWDPFREMSDIRDSFDRLFNRSVQKNEKGENVFTNLAIVVE